MKDETDITIILDRSGSMGPLRTDTIGGFNSFLADQRKGPDVARISLVTFANAARTEYQGRPISEAPELTIETYDPMGGTALLDAVGSAIDAAGNRLRMLPESERPKRVLFVIITDGQENASTHYERRRIFKMVEHQTHKYGWGFVYLGANVDAFAEAGGIGIRYAANYTPTYEGTHQLYASASANVGAMRGGQSIGSINWDPNVGGAVPAMPPSVVVTTPPEKPSK